MSASRSEFRNWIVLSLVAFFVSFSAGCGTMGGMEGKWPDSAWEMPYPPETTPTEGDILHLRTGRLLSEDELLDLVGEYRVVYVSEAHDNLAAHRIQAQILETMAARYPGTVALGMEMFPSSAQDELDRFNRGEMEEKEFRRLWANNWTVDQDYYAPLLDVVRQFGIPIIGLNIPQKMIRTITREGLDGLTEDEQAALPDMGPADPYQREFLESIFAGHSMGSGQVDRFVMVQNLWEESMAARAARYLQNRGDGSGRMLVVAGGHHIDYGFGIPRRLFRRVPVSYLTIMPRVADVESIPAEKLMDVETPALPLLPADVYWFTAYEDIPEKPKLGVGIAAVEGGVKVLHVVPNSPAEKAGIMAEDILVDIDGVKLKDTFDLIDTLGQKSLGDTVHLLLLRKGDQMEVQAELPPAAAAKHGD